MGLIVVWLILWSAIGYAIWALVWGPFEDVAIDPTSDALKALIGGGITAVVAGYLVTNAMPKWLTSSFVDVVRYLDSSPRSFQVRREIRAGVIDLLRAIHKYGRYERVVVLAHSLGSYIAYDAISYLWAEMAKLHKGTPKTDETCEGGMVPDGLLELERAASALDGRSDSVESFQAAQRGLWVGLRRHENPWLVTDLITFGSPMYFAHQLYTRDRRQFDRLVDLDELVTCPPHSERKQCNNINQTRLFFSWNNRGYRVLHDAAPFAVVRWTNLWFPAMLGFFGDWFGGRLAPLFGHGVKDIKIFGNRCYRWLPGAAHASYLASPDDRRPESFAAHIARILDLNPSSWIPKDLRKQT